ncbi:MAG: hypothetical protein WBF17_08770 [Phycisphaerae bacterium]
MADEFKPWIRYRFIRERDGVKETSFFVRGPDGCALIQGPEGTDIYERTKNAWRSALNQLGSEGFILDGDEGRDPQAPPEGE